MNHVGFHGGSSLRELGPDSDVAAFFRCLDRHSAQANGSIDYSLLTDRLYRRFIAHGDLSAAAQLMDRVRLDFENVSTEEVDWRTTGLVASITTLDLAGTNLADVFKRYFSEFDHCVNSAETFFNSWNIYQPVRTVISDLAGFVEATERPLDDYEKLNGAPFWLGGSLHPA